MVSPPIEVLEKGNAKLKHCIVGKLTKGIIPYHRVLSFANSTWEKKGLSHVVQKKIAELSYLDLIQMFT